MEKITPQEFQRLIRSCQVLEKDGHGEKVLRRHDGIIIKIFRRKRFLSSALLFPYAQRFSRNALKLWAFDIPTIRVVKCGHCPNPARDLVWYQPVEGQTLRDYAREQSLEPLMEQLGAFVATLHDNGVLFRSLHWGNIIVQPDGAFGLIDIADLRCGRRALSVKQRQRNFHHLLRYKEDRSQFFELIDLFCQGYAERSGFADETCRQWLVAATESGQDKGRP
ncbi:toluene tolerance protein [Desulfuromonas acetoxidans]|uniref:Mn2+-dependent serine/threonine protein kinase n=1 Tax=Desulfuromonas acetoxidans (strain DSM 684 / 11070) TaxID=281689 RepID=Q1K155_DESA6|nr:lipopolysaccharide kinase InaA family protein [Desulfuromonas acetoxidans]EAT16153.1 Mn2+-dependent serine/threonine protein kinase [Desulfuromonas acetoxidans DSM 684]NVD25494.1 toluene tolerance protein [Desulfuromonas acetoxidans]NVE17556.1 toluene tolerance protein [Desulfuromonas acetoxidans]